MNPFDTIDGVIHHEVECDNEPISSVMNQILWATTGTMIESKCHGIKNSRFPYAIWTRKRPYLRADKIDDLLLLIAQEAFKRYL